MQEYHQRTKEGQQSGVQTRYEKAQVGNQRWKDGKGLAELLKNST